MASVFDAVIPRWFTPDFIDREPAIIDGFRQRFAATDVAGYARCCEAIGGMDLRERIGAIAAPTLIVVGADDPARNWLAIRDTLVVPTGAVGHPMPLEGDDYPVPDVVDVAQLGIGTDGHTASLIPGDPVLDVTGVDVALAGPYQGAVRLTLTAEAINRIGVLVWQVVGADKHVALRQLMDGDPSIPAGLIRRGPRVIVVADDAAAHG